MAFAKNFGRLKQVIGERVGSVGKTEYDDTFKEQSAHLVKTSESIERLHDALEGYVRALRKSSDVAGEHTKILLVEVLGLCIHARAEAAGATTPLGKVCIEVGKAHEAYAVIQQQYIDDVQKTLGASLDEKLAEIKEYEALKTKLEGRRLDYDNKHNSVVRAKKEKPELEEALRVAQERYDETMEETGELMTKINGDQEAQIASLKAFVDAELSFHSSMTNSLQTLQAHLASALDVAHKEEQEVASIAPVPSATVTTDTAPSPQTMPRSPDIAREKHHPDYATAPRRILTPMKPLKSDNSSTIALKSHPHFADTVTGTNRTSSESSPEPPTSLTVSQSAASVDAPSVYQDAQTKLETSTTVPVESGPPPITPRSQMTSAQSTTSSTGPTGFRKPPAKFSYLAGMTTPTQFTSSASLTDELKGMEQQGAGMSTPSVRLSRADLATGQPKDATETPPVMLPCTACECNEFSIDRFKGLPHCNNCYHKHPQKEDRG